MDAVRPVTPRPALGERWVVRHRLGDGSATDVIGVVVKLDATMITVRTRAGEPVQLPWSSVIIAKRVPSVSRGPAPERTSAEELERIASTGWRAHHRPLGGWELRAAAGFTRRANSCLAVGDPGRPFELAATMIIDFARQHGIAPLAQVIIGSDVDHELAALGWRQTGEPVDVLTARLSNLADEQPDLADEESDGRVVIDDHLTAPWRSAFTRYRTFDTATSRPDNSSPAESTDAQANAADQLLLSGPPIALAGYPGSASTNEPAVPISIGRGHLTGLWLGVSALWTDPSYRRQGRATAVLTALVHWAAAQGARNAYLQVSADNETARAAYHRQGFTPHHSYRYRTPAH